MESLTLDEHGYETSRKYLVETNTKIVAKIQKGNKDLILKSLLFTS